jgi:hypothetical protein
MIQQLLKNWKTTAAGVTMISGATIHLIFAVRANTADENSWTIAIGAIIGGLGLMFAGDSNVSEQAASQNAAAIEEIKGNSNPVAFVKPPTPTDSKSP